MKDYSTNDFRKLGITEVHVECGIGFAKDDMAPYEFSCITFKQFIPHRDAVKWNPVIGDSLITTQLIHKIKEVGSIEEGMEKVRIVAERALTMVLGGIE